VLREGPKIRAATYNRLQAQKLLVYLYRLIVRPTSFELRNFDMKTYMLKAVAAAAIGCASIGANAAITLAQPVGAVGVASYAGSLNMTLIENFGGETNPANNVSAGAMTTVGAPGNATGTYGIYAAPGVTGQYAVPLNTTGNFLSVPRAGGTPTVTATYRLTSPASIFGFYLGSPDLENTIAFSLNGTVVGATTTIASLLAGPGFVWNGDNGQSRYLTLNAGGSFNEVTFGTSRIAMEVDNFTSAVPEPGEWAMLMAGLGVVSLIARRRKSKA
jgi:hypothetical protein